jgi:CBS domain-containing protein
LSREVQEFIERAINAPVELTIRQLLGIWEYKARTYENVARIQRDLSAAGLQCEPDLAAGDGDTLVRVSIPSTPSADDVPVSDDEPQEERDEQLQLPPVALLVKHIPSAIGGVTSVRPDESLEKAKALMSAHDYSQLAILSDERDLTGAVSWRSIAIAGLSKSSITLAGATTPLPAVVHANEELLRRIDVIYRDDFVFVRDADHRISGIVTTADLTAQFRDLTTPFFQLGEIEGRLRRCIDRAFSAEDLRAGTGNKKLRSAENMTFGEYIRLLNDKTRWAQMHWGVDCATFIDYLDAARMVRNKVMHFGEQLKPADEDKLKQCLNFMRALDPFP